MLSFILFALVALSDSFLDTLVFRSGKSIFPANWSPFTSAYGTQNVCGHDTIQENGGTNYTSGVISTTSGTQATLTYKATISGSSSTSILFQYSL